MRSAFVPIAPEGCPSVWHMSDQQTKSVLKLPIGDLVKAGANAPAVLVREVAQRRGPKLSAEAAGHRRSADFDVEAYVDRLIKTSADAGSGAGSTCRSGRGRIGGSRRIRDRG